MGYISEKYNIPQSTVIQMIRDGIIDWKLEGLYEFWKFYQELYKNRDEKSLIKDEIMFHYNLKCERTYYRRLKKAELLFS